MLRRAPTLRGRLRRSGGVLSLMLASTGLALVIWFLITDSGNEPIEEPLRFALTIESVNIPSGLATASSIPTAAITISGRPDEVERVTIDDFEASINLAGLREGTHEIPVRVRSLDGDVRVRSVAPESVVVTLEPVVQRTIPVTAVLANPPPLGFEIGAPVLSVDSVTVSGIQQLVDLVDTVVARVDVTGATVDVNRPGVALQARTSSGAVVSGPQFVIEPATVDVLVPIQQELFQRAVAVSPQLVGEPAPGYRIAAVTIEPLTVVVVGTLEALEDAQASTTPISIANLNGDLIRVVSAVPREGLTLEENTRVTVRVEVEPVTAQAVFDIPVAVVNLAEGLEALPSPLTVRITVIGPAPVIAELIDAELRVIADAADLGTGLHTVPVRVGFSGSIELTRVEPEDIDLVILPGETPSEGGEGEPESQETS